MKQKGSLTSKTVEAKETPVFGFFDQVMLHPVCSATQTC